MTERSLAKTLAIANVDIIDSSPKRIKKNRSILSLGNLRQAARLGWQFTRKVRHANAVLIFGSNGFLLSLIPFLVLIAKLSRTPCFVRSFGGSLDQFAAGLPSPLRWLLLFGFRLSDGLIVETQLLHGHFAKLLDESAEDTRDGTGKVFYAPGYRPMPELAPDTAASDAKAPTSQQLGRRPLRLLFIAWVRAEKGVSVLLDALVSLPDQDQELVVCDLYGPILGEYRAEFKQKLAQTPAATYQGVLEPESVLETMRRYDALVFPSFYAGEGHPGVIIESMSAGIPVITTRFRSIPEVVEDGVNGLLVTPEDAQSLALIVRSLIQDRTPLAQMGIENWNRRREFDIDAVLPLLVQPIIELGHSKEKSIR